MKNAHRMLGNIVVRLVVYYLSMFVFLAGAFHFLPRLSSYVTQQRERSIWGDAGADAPTLIEMIENAQEGLGRVADLEGINLLIDPSNTIPVVVALILAFGVTLPVSWVYGWTRPPKKYNQSFISALLVTPIGIALVVFLVKGSIPLALGLAGIVAAVRFRATIKEPIDSVYMLVVIGIGLAAGAQLISVAYVASLVFVAIALGVWGSGYGSEPPVLSGWWVVPRERPGRIPDQPETAKVKRKRR